MTRIVCDTNVIVSGLLWHGAPRRVLSAVEQGRAELCTCRELLHELALVLHYEKLARVLTRAELSPNHVLQWLAQHAEVVAIAPLPAPVIIADPSDDLVLACAVAAQARVILSGDHHLLAHRHYDDIAIRRAAEWLRSLLA